MENYTLFLDEIHGGAAFEHFSLVGFIISDSEYIRLIKKVEQIKVETFGDKNVIIHEKEFKSKLNNSPFKVFRNAKKLDEFWEQIAVLIEEMKLIILSVCVNENKIEHLYGKPRSKYGIALQVILENYLHFLDKKDAYGKVVVESTNAHPQQADDQLQQQFYHLKANGTLFYERAVFQKRIGTISFPLKVDNNIGLQIADLLPNTVNRYLSEGKYPLRTGRLMEVILANCYNGGCDQPERFGIKVIP